MNVRESSLRVAEHDAGPLLVLGGPGTGKTTALEERFLRLAQSPGLAPHRILFLCTNRTYSMQAKDRLVWALPQQAVVEVPVFTWHALAYHLVSRFYPKLDYREPPILLTGPEQWGFVRERLTEESQSDWPRWRDRLRDRAFVDEISDFCLRAQQRFIEDQDLDALAKFKPDWEEVVRFYRKYRVALRQQSRLDYSGLVAAAAELLGNNEDVRQRLWRRFPHVLVDEGEEVSPGELRLLVHLDTSNLVIAADPDCGIGSFRGAHPEWVYGFENHFGPHDTVLLERSRRLGSPLAEAAQSLISHNNPEGARRVAGSAPNPTEFECLQFPSAAEEVDAIAKEVRRLHLVDEVPWNEVAVLVSQPRYLLEPLERALERWEVPYIPASGDRPLSSEPAIACFLDLVRVALKEDGWIDLLANLLTCPLVGIDYAGRRELERRAWNQRQSLAEIVETAEETSTYRELRDLVLMKSDRADECFWAIYTLSAYYRELVARASHDPSDAANSQVDALVAFAHALGRFVERRHGRGSIKEYLYEAARAEFGGDPWLPPSRVGGEAVQVLTFHAAKGREWDTVLVAGCLDAWIPKGRRAQGLFDPFALEIAEIAAREVEAIADDRRTFYVAATRARRKAIFTVSPGPSGRGRPSRFLMELSGAPPVEAPSLELPPLTFQELRGRLRRSLNSPSCRSSERIAALAALSELPGTDPQKWYGRWDWTEGAAPLIRDEFETSYSRLGVYENCGLQYVLQSVLGLDPTSTHSMKFGTWMHALFEAVHEERITTPAQLLSEYGKQFDESIFPNATIARQFRRDGEKMLETFWTYERSPRTVVTEHWFEFDYEGAKLRGRIDRIDKIKNTLKLTDYKTSKWASGKEAAEESLQLAIYHLAARVDPTLKELGEPKVARLVYPGATWSDGKPIDRTQNDEQADVIIAKLPELISRVTSEKFEPSPEADCMWCAMKPLCPLWPQGREVS